MKKKDSFQTGDFPAYCFTVVFLVNSSIFNYTKGSILPTASVSLYNYADSTFISRTLSNLGA